MKKISIIIPVYNALPYLHECVDSIISQIFENWEIVFVDDCSTDDSYNELLKYAKKDNRIQVYKMDINSGSGPARNFALDNASGQYIMFMDPDDFYPSNKVLEKLYNVIEENDCDMAGGNMQDYFNGVYKSATQFIFDKTGLISNTDYPICSEYCRFIYNYEIISKNNIRFPNYRRYQDPVFLAEVLCFAKKIYTITDNTYVHRKEHKKVNWDSEKINGLINAYGDCVDFCKKSKRKLCLNRYYNRMVPYELFNSILPYCLSNKKIKPIFSFYKKCRLSFIKFVYLVIKRIISKIFGKLIKLYVYPIAICYYFLMMISMYKAKYFHGLSISFLNFSLKYNVKGRFADALVYASRCFNNDEKNKLNKLLENNASTKKQKEYLNTNVNKSEKRQFVLSKIKKLDINLFKDKSIAIVGNSPIEKGKDRGKEIDSHDYVLRLNNYELKDEFVSDYGSKCNIWGFVGNDDVNKRKDLSSYEFLILRDDIFQREFSDKVLNTLSEYLKEKNIYYIGREADIEFCKKYNLFNISTGLGFILALKNCNINFYGFGFEKKQYNEKNRHYYTKYMHKRKERKYHIWETENRILNDIRMSRQNIGGHL